MPINAAAGGTENAFGIVSRVHVRFSLEDAGRQTSAVLCAGDWGDGEMSTYTERPMGMRRILTILLIPRDLAY